MKATVATTAFAFIVVSAGITALPFFVFHTQYRLETVVLFIALAVSALFLLVRILRATITRKKIIILIVSGAVTLVLYSGYVIICVLLLSVHPEIVALKDIDGLKAGKMEKAILKSWFPRQQFVFDFMGKTKLTGGNHFLVSDDQIKELYDLLEPGDIIFQRKNGYLSNIGVSGFWKHSAIYVGTLEKLDKYFKEETKALFQSSFSSYLKIHFSEVYTDKKTMVRGISRSTIESTVEGVVMKVLNESAKVDSLAIIRPRLPKLCKLKMLLIAFSNYKKPYDYNFNFKTDKSFSCTELIYKSYLPETSECGLLYKLNEVAGRLMILPNDMVKNFDELFDTSRRQNDFVLFLYGDEKTGHAVKKDLLAFRNSWKHGKPL